MWLFFDLSRAGLSWQAGTGATQTGTLTEFWRAAQGCSVLVCRGDPAGKIEAIRKRLGETALSVVFVDAAGAGPANALSYVGNTMGGILPAGAIPSDEQWAIVAACLAGSNIVCRAVAGAGKTTTLLMCASRDAGPCLLLTYNKRLQVEVARRAKAFPNLTVRTYHAAAGQAYGITICNDDAFRQYVKYPPDTPQRFQKLMLDEGQDMSVEFYAYVRHMLRANPEAQRIIVGDELQAINQYRGAHPEFLTEAATLFSPAMVSPAADISGECKERPWAELRLSVSQRLTPATAEFVNTHLYGAPLIVGGNRRDPNLKPIYVAAGNLAATTKHLEDYARKGIAKHGPSGVFVLAASVRRLDSGTSPVAELVRRLRDVPMFVAGGDEAVNEDLTRGKLAILSFNAVKGCERPYVIVVGLDELHFKFFDKAWADTDRIPNVLTVAATRASAQLVVIAQSGATLRTVRVQRLSESATIVGTPRPPKVRAPRASERICDLADALRHLHPEVVRGAMERVISITEPTLAQPPAPTRRIRFGNYTEDVGFVYDMLPLVLAEVARTGTTAFGADLEAPTIVAGKPGPGEVTVEEHAAYPSAFWEELTAAASTDPSDRSPEEWCRLAVGHFAVSRGRHHVARQILHYNWLESEALFRVRDMILTTLEGCDGSFFAELPVATVESTTLGGRADFLDSDGRPWRFAVEMQEAHVLRLGCEVALLGGGEGILVAGGQKKTITVTPEDARPLLEAVASRAGVGQLDVYELIRRFDETGMVLGDTTNAGDPRSDNAAMSLDDMYD